MKELYSYENTEGVTLECELPVRMVVCAACRGSGEQLCAGLRGVVMNREDWSDEEWDEMIHGTRYNVTCESCGGKRVTPEVYEGLLNKTQREFWDRYCEYHQNLLDMAREEAHEREMGY